MNGRKIAAIAISISLASTAFATTVVPRKSPDFTIVEPSGKETALSSFKGKVIVIEFLFLRSAHCLRVAQTLNRLHHELGSRGFQPVGIVFGPGADVQNVTYLAEDFKLTYPVGYTNPAKVDSYLGRESNEVLNIPQLVLIDRAGVIRAQTGKRGGADPSFESENSLRTMIHSLLREEAPANDKSHAVLRGSTASNVTAP